MANFLVENKKKRRRTVTPRYTLSALRPSSWRPDKEEEEEEEEFFNHYKNDLERHAHTPSGVAGADLKSQSGGALRTPTLSRFSPPMTCTIPLPNLEEERSLIKDLKRYAQLAVA